MRRGLVAVAVAGLMLTLPAAAQAIGEPAFHCKNVHSSPAWNDPNPSGPPPLAIGDSTMLLPIPDLNALGFDVNARGCRGFKESVDVAAALKRQGQLPHLVLVNAYGNGGVNPDLMNRMLGVLGPKRVLGLVTAYNADTGHPPAPDTGLLFKTVHEHPHQVFVLNWVKYSLPHHVADPNPAAWFIFDLFHPNYNGAIAYAFFLAQALPLAERGKFPPLTRAG